MMACDMKRMSVCVLVEAGEIIKHNKRGIVETVILSFCTKDAAHLYVALDKSM